MHTFKVIIVQDENGGYIASIPALNHCISRGESIDEAIINIQEAMEGVIETMKSHGLSIPTSNHFIETSVHYPRLKTDRLLQPTYM